MQAYAPQQRARSRQLLVFVCPADACCAEAHAFTALRVVAHEQHLADSTATVAARSSAQPRSAHQGRHSGHPVAQPGAARAGAAKAAAPAQARGDAFSAASASAAQTGSTLDFDDILAELHELSNNGAVSAAALNQRTETGKQPEPQAANAQTALPPGVATPAPLDAGEHPGDAPHQSGTQVLLDARLPEFWVEARADSSGAEPRAAARVAAELAHAQELLQGYRTDEEQDADGAGGGGDGVNAAEAYEAPTAFDRFHRLLQHQPDQCVRWVAVDAGLPALCVQRGCKTRLAWFSVHLATWLCRAKCCDCYAPTTAARH